MLPLELVELRLDRPLAFLFSRQVNAYADEQVHPGLVQSVHIHGGHDRPAVEFVDQPRQREAIKAVMMSITPLRQGVERGVQSFFSRFLCSTIIWKERFFIQS